MKKLAISVLLCMLIFSAVMPLYASADESTRQMVEEVISGNQDFLVFASIIEKGTSAYEVQVYEEIGVKTVEGASGSDASGTNVDQRINVVGFENYMYYENYTSNMKR